jgi:hypothetical protein
MKHNTQIPSSILFAAFVIEVSAERGQDARMIIQKRIARNTLRMVSVLMLCVRGDTELFVNIGPVDGVQENTLVNFSTKISKTKPNVTAIKAKE